MVSSGGAAGAPGRGFFFVAGSCLCLVGVVARVCAECFALVRLFGLQGDGDGGAVAASPPGLPGFHCGGGGFVDEGSRARVSADAVPAARSVARLLGGVGGLLGRAIDLVGTLLSLAGQAAGLSIAGERGMRFL